MSAWILRTAEHAWPATGRDWYKSILVLLCTFLFSGCSTTVPAVDASGPITIYVVSHGWHSGIVVPADKDADLAFLNEYFDRAGDTTGWYEIGYGDRRFYQSDQTSTWLMLRAGLLPTAAALHVVSLPEMPGDYFRHAEVIAVDINHRGYRDMTAAMADTFSRDGNNDVIQYNQGLYGDSRFFAAKGSFHAFNNCNSWTAAMLDRAGVPVSTFMVLRPEGIMRELKQYNHATQ